jgi:hypothetical protein
MNTDRKSRRRLRKFFIRLAEDEDLLKSYLADPASVMSQHNLHSDHIRAITQGNVRAIYTELGKTFWWCRFLCPRAFGTIVTGTPVR